MAKSSRSAFRSAGGIVEIKSKFEAEFRRFSIDKNKTSQFDEFYLLLEELHGLIDTPFVVTYTDPVHMDLLPINNNENFIKALTTARPGLKVILQKKGESYGELYGYGLQPVKRRNPISKLMSGEPAARPRIKISVMEDFRRVSAIIDVDIVPETHRRVKLMKNGSDKPLGFYIRDGTSVRVTPQGLEKVPAIFISRLVPGGLAESTGLLAVNDEVLEVNGIEVAGKKLDQVTDMMVANSSNLIITVKPVNQHMTLAPQRGAVGRHSNMSSTSQISHQSQASNISYHSAKSFDNEPVPEVDDEDEIHDHLSPTATEPPTSIGESSSKDNKSSASDPGFVKSENSEKGASSNNNNGSKAKREKVKNSEVEKENDDPIVTL
ncbi:partitioning defective protein 6 [Aplysia californica]|uniref:Partitioning defective protein 6 n=1 Tax=Aplysia californica TaxID=6500 RepID=A0ABM0JL75_APLCA|nr:partitioning defective protein 6 [Aplysia californica]